MLRLTLVAPAIAALTLALLPAQMLAVRLGWPARKAIPGLYHRLVCRLIGVRIQIIGAPPRGGPVLLVANHSSWLDIPVLTAVAPVVFVAKSEVATWPLFGLLARLQRTVFVDRGRRSATRQVGAEMAERMHDGDPVVLFAEGTSSDNARVLPFRSALIGATHAAMAGDDESIAVAVQPVSVAYVNQHGVPLGRHQRNGVAWYGAADLLPHLAGVIRRGAVDVVVSFGEPMAFSAALDRKAAARQIEAAVRRMTIAALRPVEIEEPAAGLQPLPIGA